ncbi:exopolysaccharide production negative regulator [Zhengella mangrovi]|uniref:Exopolysaccharide production negative regulator n=1 Tax=Zhengella mangrovi TaxID=1982044 RepID=A0A2G1QR17_9HYPH|nr:exopolysaccharide production negative regulator [Zhengella mangrovi]
MGWRCRKQQGQNVQSTVPYRSRQVSSAFLALGFILLLPVSQAAAFDPGKGQTSDDPWAAFRLGFDAYRSGDKKEAVEAYRYAADKGHAGAQWKLARMYADGDGVNRNEYEAFKIFRKIVRLGAEPGSPNESYVSDALVALAGYVRRGIPKSPVHSDPRLARDLYLQAASMFGNPEAQFEMGQMLLEGDGGRANRKQAARWFSLSARKGHYKAEAMLGDLLVQDGKMVRGLAMLTAALERAQPGDRDWIRARQEEAFGLAAESDRRTAMVLADQYLSEGYK